MSIIRSQSSGYVLPDSWTFRDDAGQLVLRDAAARYIYNAVRKRRMQMQQLQQRQDDLPFEFIDGKTVRFGAGDNDYFTLPPKPYGLLKYLSECKNNAAHYDDIAANVWEESDCLNCDIEGAIDRHVSPALNKSATGWGISRKNKMVFLKRGKRRRFARKKRRLTRRMTRSENRLACYDDNYQTLHCND